MSQPSNATLNVDTHAGESSHQDTNSGVLKVGAYELGQLLGQGAMGAVYKATHVNLKRQVALKILPSGFSALPDRLARFQREMEAVGRLDHPNIVRATDAGEADGVYFIAMELVDGQDLGQLLEMRGALNLGAATSVAQQVASGLEHIHRAGLVHRDIKPSNLLLDSKGGVKILDLGIAMLHCENSQLTSTGSLLGTPDFIAPEQVTGTKDVDIRADIYSLGCTLYMLLAGKTPFHGPRYGTHTSKLIAHTNEAPIPLQSVAKNLPRPLVAVIDRMMAKDPDNRFQTPAQVAEALNEWADERQLSRNPAAIHRDTHRTKSRSSTKKSQPKISAIRAKSRLVAGGAICAGIGGFLAIQLLLTSFDDTTLKKESTTNHVATQTSQDNNHQQEDGSATVLSTRHVNGRKFAVSVEKTQTETESDQAPPKDLDNSRTIEMARNTENIAASNARIQENTAEIAATLKDLRDSFLSVADKKGAIANPVSVGEFYHNARLYQRQGKHALARNAFFQVFEEDVEYVDVHSEFQQLLRLQEGYEGAREVYGQMVDTGSAIGMLMMARLSPPSERSDALAQVIERFPDFAPAVYDRSVRVSEAVLGLRTLGEKQLEQQLLTRFLELHEQGKLVRHYLDPKTPIELLDDAQTRLHLLHAEKPNYDHPVSLSAMPHSSGWAVTISISEFATELFYRLSSDKSFKSTGHATAINAATGKPHPNYHIPLPKNSETSKVEINYIDMRGETRGPFEVWFHPHKERLRFTKQVLETTKHAWVQFSEYDEQLLLYFSHLLSYKQSIESVHFGLDTEPNREFEIDQDADPREETIYLSVPRNTKFAKVQVTYVDGEKTEVIRFDATDR